MNHTKNIFGKLNIFICNCLFSLIFNSQCLQCLFFTDKTRLWSSLPSGKTISNFICSTAHCIFQNFLTTVKLFDLFQIQECFLACFSFLISEGPFSSSFCFYKQYIISIYIYDKYCQKSKFQRMQHWMTNTGTWHSLVYHCTHLNC